MDAAAQHSGQDPFAPPGVTWQRVSPRLAAVDRQSTVLVLGPPALVAAVLAVWWTPWLWTAVGLLLVLLVWGWVLCGPQVRARGYAERDDDLLVVRGILFRSLVVVPYGRLQYVDVEAGPLLRRAGLATVQLHTASPGTDATVPGLPAAEASRLRDRLSARGEARLAGL